MRRRELQICAEIEVTDLAQSSVESRDTPVTLPCRDAPHMGNR
jgi:hypothetical protein